MVRVNRVQQTQYASILSNRLNLKEEILSLRLKVLAVIVPNAND
jgi:hypothetical protein